MSTVFLWEYLCSGAVENPRAHGSLFEEGRAMLFALLEDFSKSSRFEVVTTCAESVQSELNNLGKKIKSIPIHNPAEELVVFSRLAGEADFTLVIAPETEGVLLSRREMVDRANGKFVGCGAKAIAICGDKWNTYQQIEKSTVAQIPTRLFLPDLDFAVLTYPLVCKPRDGAGCCETFLVFDKDELRVLVNTVSFDFDRMILQPYVEGESFSVVALFEEGEVEELLPMVRHRMKYERSISCSAMKIDISNRVPDEVLQNIGLLGKAIPGLQGYVGFDFLTPKRNSSMPLLVDINPRLTTSYLEYRKAAVANLAVQLIGASVPKIEWYSET